MSLTLPEPSNVTLVQVTGIVQRSREIRAYCEETSDLQTAERLKRQLAVFQKWVADKKAKAALAGEERLTEVLIGKLLGPPKPGPPESSHDGKIQQIPKNDRLRFRQLAENESVVTKMVASGVVERAKILRQIGRAQTQAKGADLPPSDEVRLGDFRVVLTDIPDASVDVIFTDPPYDRKSIPLYSDLAAFAARVLKPGGSLLAYCGQYALPEIIPLVTAHLKWWWLCGCYHEGGNHKSLPGVKTYVLWKPIIWLVKGTNGSDEFVHDMIVRPTPNKAQHDWAQSVVDATHYISKLSPPGGVVVDPFVGSGTTLLAAKALGRQIRGAEVDTDAYARARAALA